MNLKVLGLITHKLISVVDSANHRSKIMAMMKNDAHHMQSNVRVKDQIPFNSHFIQSGFWSDREVLVMKWGRWWLCLQWSKWISPLLTCSAGMKLFQERLSFYQVGNVGVGLHFDDLQQGLQPEECNMPPFYNLQAFSQKGCTWATLRPAVYLMHKIRRPGKFTSYFWSNGNLKNCLHYDCEANSLVISKLTTQGLLLFRTLCM